jgi:hypothetical protein
MLPFAYKVPSKDVPYKAHLEVQKYRLPKYLQWVDLLDDYGIGGVMYEPTVYGWYKKYGVWVCGFSRPMENGFKLWYDFECGLGKTPEEAYLDYVLKIACTKAMSRIDQHQPKGFLESLMFWRN